MKVETIGQRIEVLTRPLVYNNLARDLELIGRVCYKSEERITETSSERFIKMLLASGHESVLEHGNISIRFITDRAMSHALVRHRHMAISQESTHYINYLKKDTLQVIEQEGLEDESDIVVWQSLMNAMGRVYESMDETKSMVKRSIFPSAIKTEIVLTTNIREWRHMMKIRTANGCHPQMVVLMTKVVEWFKETLPLFVEDIEL
jgi:thymidylate synthase (FAD)